MKIQQVQEFKLFDRRNEQLVIVHFRRIDDYFLLEKRTQDGKVIDSENVAESFANTVLEQAMICLPKSDLEVTKLSTGTKFNYPTQQI
jgi:hypothetical protein